MSIKIFACGDIVNEALNTKFIDENLKSLITNCDISIGNLEAPISTESSQPIKKAGPHLKQSSTSIECLKDSGFTLVSLANNHIYDYGQKAFQNTLNLLDKEQLDYVGGGIDFESSAEALILKVHILIKSSL